MSNNLSHLKLFKWFLKEEWRLFTSLFGEKRFISFPIVIFVLSLILGAAAPILNAGIESISIVYFSMIVLFGLQTGSIGFDARDSIKNLLGDTSRILFASKTLPIKKRTLISLFLLKDALFYSFIFLAPITIGAIVGLFVSPIESGTLVNSVSLSMIPILYISSIISFIFGVSIGFSITTIRLERISGIIIFASILSSIIVMNSYNLLSLDALASISLLKWLIGMSIATISFIGIGLIQFGNSDNISKKSRFNNHYNKMSKIINPKNNYTTIVLKNLIDIQRSAGGFLKVIFSTGVIVFTSFILIYFMSTFFGLSPKPEFIYGGLFSLIAYPIYAIGFRYDSLDSYSTLPISRADVYKSKLLLFTVIGIPLSIIFYTPFVLTDTGITSYLQGAIVLTGLMYYQFGLLMYLARDNPTEFLFNGFLFAIYSIGTLIFIIPILIIGMYGLLFATSVSSMITIYGLIAGVIGAILVYTTIIENN